MKNIAYTRRNNFIIIIRKLIHGIFKLWRKLNKFLFGSSGKEVISKIIVVTSSKNLYDLGNILNRVFWAFPYRSELKIIVKYKKDIERKNYIKIKIPDSQKNFITSSPHIEIKKIISFKEYYKADLILVTKFYKQLYWLFPWFVYKLDIADPNYYSWTEGNIWMKKYFYTIPNDEQKEIEEISKKNYEKLLSKKKKKAYCFLTGPSFENYKNFSFEENSVKIICNSIVKNNEFLNFIGGPDIIMFADCVFHFGPSKYASLFREKVIENVKKYESFIIVPKETVPLLITRYPVLKDFIIGLGKNPKYNFPEPNDLSVFGTKSIATYFMLPVASTLSEEIYFLGADGRQANEKYFWKHNSKVQFTDLMETVFETHPSFFRDRHYGKDYKEYCYHFEKLIQFGEKKGKKYYSLTRSYIPALQKRFFNKN